MDSLLQRFAPVFDHVDALDGPLPSLDHLARLAHWSPFHFHRQFRALTGAALHEWLRRRRLARAAMRLAFRSDGIGEIAASAGYANAESFARAFRREFGVAPSAFRAQPDHAALHAHEARALPMKTDFRDDDIRFETIPARRIALKLHRGAPARLGESLREFIAWRREHRLPPSRSETFNLLYDDPASVPEDDWRFGLACACDHEIAPNAQGLVGTTLDGGRHAVLAYRGGDAELEAALGFLYGEWLPRSGETPADAPLFLRRLSFYPDVPERDARSEIWLPLRAA